MTDVVKRVAIRDIRRARKPRVFDVLIMGKEVYLDLKTDKLDKTGRPERELIAMTDVIDQIREAVTAAPP